jgi:hypothetical protein
VGGKHLDNNNNNNNNKSFCVKQIFRIGICVVGLRKTTELESVVKQDTVVVVGKHLDNNNERFLCEADADVSNRNLCCRKKTY